MACCFGGGALADVVIVVPGILGSRLARFDEAGRAREVWGTGVGSLAWNLVTFGRRLRGLVIPGDVDPDDPQDGVVPVGPITDLAVIPGFWGVKGYDGLVAGLGSEWGLGRRQVRAFSYDWRLSNRVNGRLFAKFVERVVTRWRLQSGDGEAKALVVAHSMGGLVARWAIEVEECGELVRELVTFGTPFRGAAKALDAMANGFRLPARFGPSFDGLVQSLPSVRELLPAYDCVLLAGGGGLVSVADAGVLDASWVDDGARFHTRLAEAVAGREQTGGVGVRVRPVVGVRQPTLTTGAVQADGSLMMFDTIDGTEGGEDYRGDGTVPADSASPPEWDVQRVRDDSEPVAQTHLSIHAGEGAMAQLGWWYQDHRRRMDDRADLGLWCPDLVAAGEEFEVWVEGPSGLALTVEMTPLYGGRGVSASVVVADGRYRARFGEGLAGGVYEVRVVARDARSVRVRDVLSMLVAYTED